jgi:APA family basic amino acid/polyamine antiporter
VPGYPWLPLAFIGAVVYLVGSALAADPLWTAVTFGIVLMGVPVYFYAFASETPPATSRRVD